MRWPPERCHFKVLRVLIGVAVARGGGIVIDIVEAIKLVGGLSGIASVGFLIYDRIFRSRPFAYLRPHEYQVQVAIKNVAPESILIDSIEVSPPLLSLSRTNDMVGTVEAAANRFYPSLASEKSKKLFVLLEPMAERGFSCVTFPEFENTSDDTKVKIRIEWRNTRRPIPFKRNVYLRTTVGDVKRIKAAAQAKGK